MARIEPLTIRRSLMDDASFDLELDDEFDGLMWRG